MSPITYGYHLSAEEHTPTDLVRIAQEAEASSFEFATLSDHFHPWLDSQGQSPFAWTVLGALAQATTNLRVGTAVTCPIMRYRPEIIAQAAATVEMMMPGRFFLGVGTGENLNEHILGQHWPKIAFRREMLEEAVDIIRHLWTGEFISYHGEYFTVEDARIYSMPDDPPPLIVAAAGVHSAAAAGRIGDGLITTSPKKEIAQTFDQSGGKGKPRYCQMTLCWAKDMETAKKTAFEFWRTSAVPGPLHPYLSLPSYFDAISKQSNPDELAKHVPMGPDPATYVSRIKKYLETGYNQISFHQIGHDQHGFFDFFSREVMPRVERELGDMQQRAASD